MGGDGRPAELVVAADFVPVNPSVATAVIQNARRTNTTLTADVLVATTVTRDAANTIISLTFAPGGTLTAESPTASKLTVTCCWSVPAAPRGAGTGVPCAPLRCGIRGRPLLASAQVRINRTGHRLFAARTRSAGGAIFRPRGHGVEYR